MSKSKVEEVRETVSDAAGSIASTVTDAASDVAGTVGGAAGDIASKVQDATPDAVQDRAAQAGEAVGRRRRPLALLIAIGALAAVALKLLRGRR
jgi:uncharacterized protein with PhoU and TrkA domain